MQELDFFRRGHNLSRISGKFRSLQSRRCRSISQSHCRAIDARVPTTWIEGVKVSNLSRLDELGVDRDQLARTVVTAYCQQIFRDGLYHADPHPGNLLCAGPKPTAKAMRRMQTSGQCADAVARSGWCKRWSLDFGAVAELSPTMRRIVDVLQAA